MKKPPFDFWLAASIHVALIGWAVVTNWLDDAPWWSGWALIAMVFALSSAASFSLATMPGTLDPGSRGFLAGAFTVAAFGIAGGAFAHTPGEAVSAVLMGVLAAVYQGGLFELAAVRRRAG